MTRLVLMRHAEAQLAPGQEEGDRFSVADTPLSDRGRAQAGQAARRLRGRKFDAVLASPARRAQETARLVAGEGVPVRTVNDLREYPFVRPGTRYPETLAAILALPEALGRGEDPMLPGGERFGAARARFGAAMEDLLARHASPLVVAHGIANRVWLCGSLGRPLSTLLALPQGHAAVNEVRREGGRMEVLSVDAYADG